MQGEVQGGGYGRRPDGARDAQSQEAEKAKSVFHLHKPIDCGWWGQLSPACSRGPQFGEPGLGMN